MFSRFFGGATPGLPEEQDSPETSAAAAAAAGQLNQLGSSSVSMDPSSQSNQSTLSLQPTPCLGAASEVGAATDRERGNHTSEGNQTTRSITQRNDNGYSDRGMKRAARTRKAELTPAGGFHGLGEGGDMGVRDRGERAGSRYHSSGGGWQQNETGVDFDVARRTDRNNFVDDSEGENDACGSANRGINAGGVVPETSRARGVKRSGSRAKQRCASQRLSSEKRQVRSAGEIRNGSKVQWWWWIDSPDIFITRSLNTDADDHLIVVDADLKYELHNLSAAAAFDKLHTRLQLGYERERASSPSRVVTMAAAESKDGGSENGLAQSLLDKNNVSRKSPSNDRADAIVMDGERDRAEAGDSSSNFSVDGGPSLLELLKMKNAKLWETHELTLAEAVALEAYVEAKTTRGRVMECIKLCDAKRGLAEAQLEILTKEAAEKDLESAAHKQSEEERRVKAVAREMEAMAKVGQLKEKIESEKKKTKMFCKRATEKTKKANDYITKYNKLTAEYAILSGKNGHALEEARGAQKKLEDDENIYNDKRRMWLKSLSEPQKQMKPES